MPTDSNGTFAECFKCGKDIRRHLSAYEPWDEAFTLRWVPPSDDNENVTESGSGGTHPDVVRRTFCSKDCLKAFLQMYPFPPEDGESDG